MSEEFHFLTEPLALLMHHIGHVATGDGGPKELRGDFKVNEIKGLIGST